MELSNGKIFIYHLIFYPAEAIEYLLKAREDEHMGIAVLVVVAGILFNLLSKVIISMNRELLNIYLGWGGFIVTLNFVGNLILFIGVIFFIKSFTSGEENKAFQRNINYASLLFKSFCFSFVPLFFTPILSLFGLFFRFNGSLIFFYFLKLGIYFWIMFLQVYIIKTIFNMKLLSTIGLYFLPLIGLFAFIFIKIINIGITFFMAIL